MNILDYQSKDATLNPDVNVEFSCPDAEQKHSECEQTFGINAKECDEWMEMVMKLCNNKNDDVKAIWKEFQTSHKDVKYEGFERARHRFNGLDTLVANSFESMDFDDDLKLGFDCVEQAELCLLIMAIGQNIVHQRRLCRRAVQS